MACSPSAFLLAFLPPPLVVRLRSAKTIFEQRWQHCEFPHLVVNHLLLLLKYPNAHVGLWGGLCSKIPRRRRRQRPPDPSQELKHGSAPSDLQPPTATDTGSLSGSAPAAAVVGPSSGSTPPAAVAGPSSGSTPPAAIVGPSSKSTPPATAAGPSSESAPPAAVAGPSSGSASFPDGVKVLHDCPGAAVDICFVHGLTGDRERTWTADGQSTPWPKTLLPPELPNARILTYGYDAYVLRKSVASGNRLIDHATNLLNDLTADRQRCNASDRPLIFVAHSLGGLVCKKAILSSQNKPDPHLRGIFSSTKGIVFMGTPHKGAWMADWAKIPASAIGVIKSTNRSLLQVLETNNQLLESIQIDFLEMMRAQREGGRPLEVTCFFEELPLPMAGKVVSKESATLEGYNPISVHANHRDMVRFVSTEETGFRRLLGELRRWADAASSQVPELSRSARGCLQSLAFSQMHDRSNDIDRAVPGTCEWLLQHETFCKWAAGDRGLLWIQGKPGSGKSTLLKHALNKRMDIPGARPDDMVLSFFFHGRGDKLQKSPLGLFRSLLHQVLEQAPLALPDLVQTFEQKCSNMGRPGDKWQWHSQELWHFFESSLPKVLKTRPAWLFIDALDESGEQNAVDLVRKLKALVQEVPPNSLPLHICFTCRHYPVLPHHQDDALTICPERENRDDISTYVQEQLSVCSERTASTIPGLITGRANGVFMWARLVVAQVLDLDREGEGLGQIKNAVNSVPRELDELYRTLIKRMKPESTKLIQWICFSTDPLTTKELPWAMALEPDSAYESLDDCHQSDAFITSDQIDRRIKTLSCGLAETVPSSRERVVQFIHQSVKDFFVDGGLAALDSDSLLTDKAGVAHRRLSQICIRYLGMVHIDQDEIDPIHHDLTSDFPFLRYATASWVAHATHSDGLNVGREHLVESFGWPSENLVAQWVRFCVMLGIRHSWAWYGNDAEFKTSLLHILSETGMVGALVVILRKLDHTAIDSKDQDGQTPLSCAAKNGHKNVVEILLATGNVDVDSKDQRGQTPLSWAAKNGHDGIVKQLLVASANADSKDNGNRTPLSWAAKNGHDGIVKQLLVASAKADSKDIFNRTPLSWAAEKGHGGIVKQLLVTGVNVDSKDENSQTPLSWAAAMGHKGVVKQLFAAGANVDSKDQDGQTPLSWAAENGHDGVVEQLLVTGANVDSKDNGNRTPLWWAAENGHKGVVEQLLVAGANTDSKDIYGGTPLSWAAKKGHDGIVKQLLAAGANTDSKDRNGWTPLSWAAEKGHEGIVKQLLAAGANTDSKDIFNRTPLSWAVEEGHEGVVQQLLAVGANADAEDEDGRTPL